MYSLHREKQFQVLKQQEKSMWKTQNYFTTFQATLCENRIARVMFLQFKMVKLPDFENSCLVWRFVLQRNISAPLQSLPKF